jgi:hypothetical protein
MEESPFKGKTGLRRLMNAFGYSVHGFASAFRHEDAFRQEVLLAAVLIPVALVLDVGGMGKAMMIASVLLVLIVELLNSEARKGPGQRGGFSQPRQRGRGVGARLGRKALDSRRL